MNLIKNFRDQKKRKQFLREIIFPLSLLALYFIVFHFQKIISVPSQDKFMSLILTYINNQSLWIVFIIALFEGGFILGQYAPGGVVLFLSIVSAGGDVLKVILLTLIISIAFVVAYTLDYCVGYFAVNRIVNKMGLEKYVLKFEKLLEKNAFSAMFFTYWDTNLASILSVAAGSLKIPFKKFVSYSIIFVLIWNVFWSVLLFFFGNVIINLFGEKYILVVLGVWIIWAFYKAFIKVEESLA